ncbi:hypothetical protein GTQ38_14615 [Flavobacteriaceae bacterium R33]|uniref:Uncharacterized protein n=1 Tax=Poritiphilus flavus TaxID=2697053 RepID=A0A6L9EET8_9FLAO|nr:hypothetical protein [Poritiphilus flavus]
MIHIRVKTKTSGSVNLYISYKETAVSCCKSSRFVIYFINYGKGTINIIRTI